MAIKKPNRKRWQTMTIRLTPEEYRLISAGASRAGLSYTDFILACVRYWLDNN